MQLLGGDADFCTEAKLAPIGKAGGSVMVDAGSIHIAKEVLSSSIVGGDNGLRVHGAVFSNMLHRFLHIGNGLDSQD